MKNHRGKMNPSITLKTFADFFKIRSLFIAAIVLIAANLLGVPFATSIADTVAQFTLQDWIGIGTLVTLIVSARAIYGVLLLAKRYYVPVQPNTALYCTDGATTEVLFAGGRFLRPWAEQSQLVRLQTLTFHFGTHVCANGGLLRHISGSADVRIEATPVDVTAAVRQLGPIAGNSVLIKSYVTGVFQVTLCEAVDHLTHQELTTRMLEPAKRVMFAEEIGRLVAAKVRPYGLVVSNCALNRNDINFR